jgi:hypothetical protein
MHFAGNPVRHVRAIFTGGLEAVHMRGRKLAWVDAHVKFLSQHVRCPQETFESYPQLQF